MNGTTTAPDLRIFFYCDMPLEIVLPNCERFTFPAGVSEATPYQVMKLRPWMNYLGEKKGIASPA